MRRVVGQVSGRDGVGGQNIFRIRVSPSFWLLRDGENCLMRRASAMIRSILSFDRNITLVC